jgi:hypothetical protein
VPGRDPSDGGQQSPNGGVTRDPIRELIAELQSALGDSLVGGAARADAATASRWTELATTLDQLGSVRLLAPAARLAATLEQRRRDTGWEPSERSLPLSSYWHSRNSHALSSSASEANQIRGHVPFRVPQPPQT